MNRLLVDVKRYAKLLNSVAQQGTGSNKIRPMTPVECAEAIKQLRDGGDNLEKIAERLNLGKPKDTSNMYKKRDTTQVTTFLNLLGLSNKIKDLAGWAYEEYPKIPFSTLSQLSTMSTEEQNKIIQSILNTKDKKRVLGKEDVKKIKKWRRENPNLLIDKCIENVLKLKPITEINHMVVFELDDKLRQLVRIGQKNEDVLRGRLGQGFRGKFYSVKIGNSVMAISMDEEAYNMFRDQQRGKGISYTQCLIAFLEENNG